MKWQLLLLSFVGFSLAAHHSLAQAPYTVRSQGASLLEAPQSGAKVLGTLGAGKKIFVLGDSAGGYFRVQTKSGRAMFINSSQLASGHQESDDVIEASEKPKPQATEKEKSGASDSSDQNMRLTYDLVVSAGNYDNQNYTEAQLGLNLFFLKWLAWRNAGFARFVAPENYYGYDTSARLQFEFGLGDLLGVTIFGGPGYRFATRFDNAPFAEGGLSLSLAGFTIGGGVKTIYYKFANENNANDTQYFITLAGGGSLF